jgi:hypothetical protein
MSYTYLVHVRLRLAVSSALYGVPAVEHWDEDWDTADRVLSLIPADEVLLLSACGDTILLAHTSKLDAPSILSAVRKWFSGLPVADAAVLEVGPKCRGSDDGDAADDWEQPFSSWLGDGRLSYDVRPSFGPKALIITTEERPPVELGSVRHLRRMLPQAVPHWHGRNTLMLALSTDGDVGLLWSHPAVQRVVDDRETGFVTCVEIGPREAACHDLGLVLQGCGRSSEKANRSKPDVSVRTVIVERPRKLKVESGGKGNGRVVLSGTPPMGGAARANQPYTRGRTSDPRSFQPVNDAQSTANDNSRLSEIKVARRGRGKPRRRSTS